MTVTLGDPRTGAVLLDIARRLTGMTDITAALDAAKRAEAICTHSYFFPNWIPTAYWPAPTGTWTAKYPSWVGEAFTLEGTTSRPSASRISISKPLSQKSA